MSRTSTNWTAERVRSLPDDGKRYEVIDGELLVTPAPLPRHQRLVGRLFNALGDYARREGIGEALFSPADIAFSAVRLVQPDVFVTPLIEGRRPERWSEVAHLLLVVEVLSPSTAHADRVRKRQLYLEERIPEYWIVDGEARLIERWSPGEERPEVPLERLTWRPPGAHEALEIDLRELFRD